MKYLKIKDAFFLIKNGANMKQDKASGGIPITRIESIVDNKFDFNRLGFSGINDESFNNYYLNEGDILMSHINSVSHLGKVAIFESKSEKIIHGMNLLCLKSNKNIVFPKYAYYYFRTPIFLSSLIKITKKSGNQASFNILNLKNNNIPIPKRLEDQIRIATILTYAETLIQQRQESIALLDEFVKSTFYKMFGDPFRNEKGWNKVKLQIITKVGTGSTPSRSKEIEYYNGNINWIKTTEVNGSYILNSSERITEKAVKETNCKIFPENTILLAMYGQGKTRGNVGLLKINAATNQACAALLPSNNINQIFLYQSLKNSYLHLRSLARGGNQENLNLSIINNFEVIVPPVFLQNQFASIAEK